jgi:hypothetical protein
MKSLAVLFALLAASALAIAGEPTDEERRAEAHRTVLRRLSESEGAKTAKLEISKAATTFIDLYLDLERNRLAVRSREAPKSTMFRGTAHPLVKVEDGVLLYRAAFVNFVIDEARVPLADVPALVAAALDAEDFSAARIGSDDEETFAVWRMGLVALCCSQCDEPLLTDRTLAKGWRRIRDGIGERLVAALDTAGARHAYPLLQALKRVGDAEDAETLIAKIEALPEDAPRFVKPMYASAACGIDCDASRAYREKVLASEDPSLVAAALGSFSGGLDSETRELVEGYISPDAEVPEQVWRSALAVLVRDGSAASARSIRAMYDGARTESMKIEAGISLVRLGDLEPVKWLEEKITEMKASKDRMRRFRASALERALARARKEGEER